MKVLLKQVVEIFEKDIVALTLQLEKLDNMSLLTDNENGQASIFEAAEEARMKIEKRQSLIRRISDVLNLKRIF